MLHASNVLAYMGSLQIPYCDPEDVKLRHYIIHAQFYHNMSGYTRNDIALFGWAPSYPFQVYDTAPISRYFIDGNDLIHFISRMFSFTQIFRLIVSIVPLILCYRYRLSGIIGRRTLRREYTSYCDMIRIFRMFESA